jgi:uncharacterized protein (TIGR02145 family)
VSLTDERDNKNYPVLKMGDRWMMARNLNYQEGLVWYTNSAQPDQGTGSYDKLRGVFWCPGGYCSSTVTSTLASCEVWGALYAWETAMMLDGKGTWTEASTSTYNTGAANAEGSKTNQGRVESTGSTYGGRGICPPNWHVPTDNEWGIILDGMEDGNSTAHQNASSGWYGTIAGARGKSKCTTESGDDTGDAYVNDGTAYWYYHAAMGTDAYGFRVLPTGSRFATGDYLSLRGTGTFFWSSSTADIGCAWRRNYYYYSTLVNRNCSDRSNGYPVRGIRDL